MADRQLFDVMPDGTEVERLTLRREKLSCEIITYGGAVRALTVPDRDGGPVDVVLGFDTLEDYQAQDKYLGALVGRYANRIGGAAFVLNGAEYPLAANSGPNHLHGGRAGFSMRVWTVESLTENSASLSLLSPDGEEGYPGDLFVRVTYTLDGDGLSIEYEAESSADTLCNLTNHTYFNLSGHASGPVLDQEIQLFASAYTPTGAGSIPTGEIARVEGTPMDLREARPIGAGIGADFEQLRLAGGYDHNWVIDGAPGALNLAARAFSPETGIALEVATTQPGVQFYTGNFLSGCPLGKGGAPYANRWGFCLETQNFPDAPHHENFPSAVLRKGERYHHETIFRFSAGR